MKKGLILLSIFFLGCSTARGQTNVAGLHLLIGHNKKEFSRQEEARDNQAVVTLGEKANKQQMGHLKRSYREIQERFHKLGIAIDAANVGLKARPHVENIVANQGKLIRQVENNPEYLFLVKESEQQLVVRARRLFNYMIGLAATFGEINQMKSSDRRILLDHVITELRQIDQAGRSMLKAIYYAEFQKNVTAGGSPFENWVSKDKAIMRRILDNMDSF